MSNKIEVEKKMSVTEYAKQTGFTRQYILYKIKYGKMPENTKVEKIGKTYLILEKTTLKLKTKKNEKASKKTSPEKEKSKK